MCSSDLTAEYLSTKIKGYDKVVFIGGSAGGYAAILFGSLLNVDHVVAFNPQTDLKHVSKYYKTRYNWSKVVPEYEDIIPYLNDTTIYGVYTQEKNHKNDMIHHRHHSDRLKELEMENMFVKKVHLGMKGLRDSGELTEIISNHVFGEIDAFIHEEEPEDTVCACS